MKLGRVLCLGLFCLAVALPAAAAPITYFFSSGSATIRANRASDNAVVVAPTAVALDGAFVTFDADTIQLTDLSISVPTTGVIPMVITYGGYNRFVIESASILPGTGFMTVFGSPVGPGQYVFAATPLDIDGEYSAFHTSGSPAPTLNQEVPFTDTEDISGSIDTNLMTLSLTGITLATLDGAAFGEASDLDVKADIVFVGFVPEPGTAALLGFGLMALGAARRRG